jgi:hypothetical protein
MLFLPVARLYHLKEGMPGIASILTVGWEAQKCDRIKVDITGFRVLAPEYARRESYLN